MTLLYFLLLPLLFFLVLGAGHEVFVTKTADGIEKFLLVVSVGALVLLLVNIDKFFKDYSQCFPTV